MARGGKAAARVAEGIIAKAARRVMPEVAEDALKDGAKAAAKDGAKAAAKDGAEAAGKDAGRAGARDAAKAGEDTAKKVGERTATKDPIDVASGEVLLHQVDVELPGVLPLVLDRTHVSSYRTGRWFGRSWASTLDQRLEVDDAGACLVGAEALVLVYPIPMLGEPALPERGPRWPLSYGADGYVVTDPQQGRTLHFATQPNAGIPGGRATVLPLKSIIDRNGNRIDLEYDDDGSLTEVRHSAGYRIGVRTTDDRITELRLLNADDQPVLRRFEYDDRGRLTDVYNSSGRPTRLDYDPAGRLTRWTDTNGHWYAYTYDEHGRGIAGEGSGGYLNATLTYHERTTVVTDSLGHHTTYHLDERGRVTAVTDPLGNTTWSEWDAHGRLLARTDPLGHTTRFAYDDHGNLTEITRPDGARSTVAYNALDLPVEISGPDGARWRRAYDGRGNLTAATDPAGATTTFAYDDRGGLLGVTDPLGAATRLEPDSAGLTRAIADSLGRVTRCARDPFGRVSTVTDPLGGVTRFDYTVEGKPVRRTSPDGVTERWSYDGEGNLVEHVDATGQVTRFEVGQFDQRSAQTAPDGARMEFGYDSELRVISVTNPQGLIWRYDYDAAGNLVGETDFDGRMLGYLHDPAGRLVERTNGVGETTRFSRDLLGKVVEHRSGEAVTTYAYDVAGRMVRAANADADLILERDPVGRITAEICNGRALTVAYDANGRRVRRRTPSGAESRWEYDPTGQPAALHAGGQTLRFGYDAVGREVNRYVGSAVALTQQWDAGNRLRAQTLWGAPVDVRPGQAGEARMLQHRAYHYRGDGYVTGIDDRILGSRRFELDGIGRVTAVRAQTWDERYAYDSAGNLTDASWPGSQQPQAYADADAIGEREYSGTLIRRAGSVRYEHDGQGRMVLRQHKRLSSKPYTWRYFWNADDRLTGVVTPEGQRWHYRYDPLGRRIAKQRLSPDGQAVIEQVDFAWNGMTLAEQAHTGRKEGDRRAPDGQVAQVTAWDWAPGSFRPISQTERVPLRDAPQQWVDQAFYAIVTDLVGTPAEMVDAAGNITWHSQATVWGSSQPAESQGRAYCPLRFPGQYFDPETGLHYNHHRYYEPATGRYGSSDPLGLRAAPNPQTYVHNPLTWLDPLGLSPYLYRGMKDDEGVPEIGESARTLGARRGDDIPIDENGMVHPGTGGVSVSPNSAENLPKHRRPPEFGGIGKDPVWKTDSGSLPEGLTYRPDPANPAKHGFIEPSRSMSIDEYQGLLGSSQEGWKPP